MFCSLFLIFFLFVPVCKLKPTVQFKVMVLKGRGGHPSTTAQLARQVILCAKSNTKNTNRIQLTEGTRMWTINRQRRTVQFN
jgi:hypothetical protein